MLFFYATCSLPTHAGPRAPLAMADILNGCCPCIALWPFGWLARGLSSSDVASVWQHFRGCACCRLVWRVGRMWVGCRRCGLPSGRHWSCPPSTPGWWPGERMLLNTDDKTQLRKPMAHQVCQAGRPVHEGPAGCPGNAQKQNPEEGMRVSSHWPAAVLSHSPVPCSHHPGRLCCRRCGEPCCFSKGWPVSLLRLAYLDIWPGHAGQMQPCR